jgi:hypothetical protein
MIISVEGKQIISASMGLCVYELDETPSSCVLYSMECGYVLDFADHKIDGKGGYSL